MKAIMSDKLYDTETLEIVFEQKPDEILYRTEKGKIEMLDIEKIKERVAKATPGPWGWITKGNTVQSRAVTTDMGECGVQKVICASISPKTGDADFIAHARQADLPRLH